MFTSRTHSLLGFAALCLGVTPAAWTEDAVVASVPIKLYGYTKVDAIHETRETQGVQPRWVADVDADDGRFFMSARQSRIGLRIDGPDAPGLDLGGTIEVDFYGDGNDDKVNALSLIHI